MCYGAATSTAAIIDFLILPPMQQALPFPQNFRSIFSCAARRPMRGQSGMTPEKYVRPAPVFFFGSSTHPRPSVLSTFPLFLSETGATTRPPPTNHYLTNHRKALTAGLDPHPLLCTNAALFPIAIVGPGKTRCHPTRRLTVDLIPQTARSSITTPDVTKCTQFVAGSIVQGWMLGLLSNSGKIAGMTDADHLPKLAATSPQ